MTYLPGGPVIEHTILRRERWPAGYRLQVTPLVTPGQEVRPDQPVLRYTISSQATPVEAPLGQGLPLQSSPSYPKAPATLPAGLHGRVVEITSRGGVVIESHAAVLRGMIGAGSQVAGIVTLWQPGPRSPQTIPPGALLVIPGPLTFALLRQALLSGVVGVIASGMPIRDLEGFLHTDLLQLLDSNEPEQAQKHLPPLTICLTEGTGTIAMPEQTLALLRRHEGAFALLSGITSTHYSVTPELIISFPSQDAPPQPETRLHLGSKVRICCGLHQGKIGTIDHFFAYEQRFPSGIYAPAARLAVEDGAQLVVPLYFLQVIS